MYASAIFIAVQKALSGAQTEDTDEKRLLGELWEAKSGGRALFLMAEKRDSKQRGVYDQIRAKIES